jgi:guanylate kinase
MESSLETKLASYKPAAGAIQLIKTTPILLFVGPTGAGKDSLKFKLLEETSDYHHIVSHTTRSPRINQGELEIDGEDYHFIDKAKAEQMLDVQDFIEAKIYSGNLYGTSVCEIQVANDEGKIAMTDIEVQGVAEYKSLDPKVMAIFLLPPSFKVWQDRLMHRYGDVVDAEDHRLRLQTGLTELDQLINNDYYIPVINDDLDLTFENVRNIVSKDSHINPDEDAARVVASELARDIQAYLDKR